MNLFEEINGVINKVIPGYSDGGQTGLNFVSPGSSLERALITSQRTGEELRQKTSAFMGEMSKKIPETTFNFFENISRAVGGILTGNIQPKPGATSITEALSDKPMFGEVVAKGVSKIPVVGKIPYVPTAAGFLSEMLLPPYGPAKGESFILKIAKTTEKPAVEKLLLEGIKDIKPEEAAVLAEKLAPITDKKVIKNELENFARSKMQTAPEVSAGVKPIPKELEPLAGEARKYKSAEEFVKEKMFEMYVKQFKADIQKSITEAERKELYPSFLKDIKKYGLEDVGRQIRSYVSYYKKEIPNIDILTRPSQLTDFYNQVIKGVKEVKPVETKSAIKPQVIKPNAEIPKELESLAKEVKPEISVSQKPQIPELKPQIEGKPESFSTPPQKELPIIKEPQQAILKGQSTLKTDKASLSKDYRNLSENASELLKAEKNLAEKDINPEKIADWDKIKNSLDSWWTKFNTAVQDNWYRVRDLVKQKGIKVSDETNPYLKKELYIGRVDTAINELKQFAEKVDKDILTTSKKLGTKDTELQKDINDYLIARHAPERNLAIGEKAAGITTKEAENLLKEIQSKPHFKEVERIANKISEANKKTLDILLDGGVIDKKLYDTLKNKYKYHIPLNRVFDDEDIIDVLTSRGFDVKGTGLFRAKGSEREIADIIDNVVANQAAAIVKAEKNKVDLATLKFVRENNYFNGLFEEIKPKAIGFTHDGIPILKKNTDPLILELRENGKPVWLKINNKDLAITLKGINKEKLDGFTRIIASITRLMSGLATRWNINFALPNKIRDLQETLVYLASKKEIGLKGGLGVVKEDIKTGYKGVLDYLRGVDSPQGRLYKELKEMGGTTGGLSLSTRKQLELDLNKIRQLNRSKPRQAAQKIVEAVDNWNTIFEDSTRLSVYKKALDKGLSKEQAAFLAKEATINFNRIGTAGPIINALYMFSNASIQGSVKMLRALRNPKVLAGTVGIITGAVMATQEWNDKIDPQWRDKVSKWDRMNGLPVVLPSTDEKFNYVVIPVGWGIKPLVVMDNSMVDLLNDKKSEIKDIMGNVLASIIDAYNPVGGTDLVQAITPSLADIPIDIMRNRKWTGTQIRPEYGIGYYQYMPETYKYFDSLKDSTLGRILVGVTDKVYQKSGGRIEVSPADIKYAIEQLTSGVGKETEQLFETAKLVTGEKPEISEIPLISRFIRSKKVEETGADSKEVEKIKNIFEKGAVENFKIKQEAENIYEQIKKIPKDQRGEVIEELKNKNPELLKKIIDIMKDEEKGLNSIDRKVKMLSVDDRAEYYKDRIKSFQDKEARRTYIKDQINKGLLTKKVLDKILNE